ncbi:ABC transporter ATP-binding protein [Synergistaceae bacterium OttesenSCG-928-I11]|nr:ABC transporter ATP-binding protein [Synergistaceae bacterium OttesenSCG-928-I11]
MSLLEIRDLMITFQTQRGLLPAVSGIDIEAQAGEIVGVVGESGCGKTVTALSVMGLLPDRARTSGEILLDGTDLLGLTPEEMRRTRGTRISMIFQEPMAALNPVLTVGRQLTEPLVRIMGIGESEATEQAVRMLETVHVSGARERLSAYPHQLSGGLCQRVMIAMALIRQPRLLIADEPTTALDVTIQAQILDLLRELRDRTGTAILLITHDLGVVAELCDRVYVMYAGHVMEQGNVYQIFDDPMHPYAYGLMRSMPEAGRANTGREELYSIPGTVPDLMNMPSGCPFCPRCAESGPLCREILPQLVRISKGHAVRCWKYVGTHRAHDADRTEEREGARVAR